MSIFQTIILAVIEGLTEFLPISSTGHMILAGKFLTIQSSEFLKSFEIIIQLGAICAVIILYFNTLIKKINIWPKIITAFIPTAFLGMIFYKIIKQFLLGNFLITILSLGIGGFCFLLLEKLLKNKPCRIQSIENISYKDSFIIGLSQSISMIPGVSRSAASIFGAMLIGVDRRTSVEFSFLLAIPTIAAASALDVFKNGFLFSKNEYSIIGIGFIISFITALIAIKTFLKFIQKNTFTPFAWYRILLSIICALYLLKT